VFSSLSCVHILTSSSLDLVRAVEGIVGLVVPLVVSNGDAASKKTLEWYLSLPCSLLHDLGTFCIVLSLTRALFHALDIWDLTVVNILRRLWGWILVLLPIPGYLFAGFVVPFRLDDPQDLQSYDSKQVNGYSAIAYALLRANLISLGVTLLAMIPFFIFVLIKRRRDQVWSSSTASATAITFFPTLILMIVYILIDMMRFSINQRPTMTEQFALSLAPEVIITAIWLALARHIGKCDKEFLSHQEDMRNLKEQQWYSQIDKALEDTDAFGLADTPEEAETKNLLPEEQLEENVYSCARYRLRRLYEYYHQEDQQSSQDFEEEARFLVEDAKENARLIARCLVLAPCENCPFLGEKVFSCGGNRRIARSPFNSKKTEKLVLEAMRKDEAMKGLGSEELEWAVGDIVRIHLV